MREKEEDMPRAKTRQLSSSLTQEEAGKKDIKGKMLQGKSSIMRNRLN